MKLTCILHRSRSILNKMFVFQKAKVVSREGGVVTLSVTADVHVSSDQEGAATGDSAGDPAEPGTLKQDVSKVGAFCCQ